MTLPTDLTAPHTEGLPESQPSPSPTQAPRITTRDCGARWHWEGCTCESPVYKNLP